MFGATATVLALGGYVLLLFLLALWVENKSPRARALSRSPLVYSLSLGVYCTSWTFYGSVGMAVTSGVLIYTTYLGPTLAAFFWPVLLPRMIRLKNRLHSTSIADFISARYGKSPVVAALAAILALLGVAPYLALQLRSVISAFSIVAGPGLTMVGDLLGAAVVLCMILFTLLFGLRRLDPTERHPGMMAVVAAESAVKLMALTGVGLFVVFGVNDGFADLFARAGASGRLPPTLPEGAEGYVRWTSFLILSASAALFLPRQFHVAVVENASAGHVRMVTWFFPLYLFCSTLFILPIAVQGLLSGLPREVADTYVLRLPMLHDRPWLTLLVFLGGFSAAAGMIMVSSVTLATMAVNHLLLPLADMASPLHFLRRRLLGVRRVAAAGIIILAGWYENRVGEALMLADMGIVSFAAVLQFAPALLLGLFWRNAGRMGAILGLGGGLLTWLYTMIVPALARSGRLPGGLLEQGLFGIPGLRPEALFGLADMDRVTHAVFWSLAVNVGLFAAGSIFFRQNGQDRRAADIFSASGKDHSATFDSHLEKNIDFGHKRRVLAGLLEAYFPEGEAAAMVNRRAAALGLADQGRMSVLELANLHQAVEAELAGAVGAAAASQALPVSQVFTPRQREELSEAYGRLLAELRLSPEELVARIDFHRERERLMRDYSRELEARVEERTRDLAAKAGELATANERLCELDRMKSAFLSSVSHELRTPLTSIMGFARLVARDYHKTFAPLAGQDADVLKKARRAVENMEIIRVEAARLTQLVDDVLDLTYIEDGRMVWRDAPLSPSDLATEAAKALKPGLQEHPALSLRLDVPGDMPQVMADRERLLQVLGNLLSNAVKFSRAGEIVLGARIMPEGGVGFFVSDQGPGVPEADRERIFEKFHQKDRSGDPRDKPRGTGLGLSICKGVATRYGGRIWVTDRPGGGSVFWVWLPPGVLVWDA
ncbi:histidine kinase [Desulfovibrio sulfodismutans]|uniref:histidine kinase n=1 Tax=Desulfolutivibrio sulfodismutans TaxID=63561 RepID=A0A7K3NIV3_9BACT|nr:ATP-binding protein [Desulfolutivibrio sulfodismutans]NDY56132.1 histidine kinase [Desulfolutivibrio sulfodismutans]QLA13185.1 histidine kinase [Desulfolutivibrio sulfodismutans DSM 3696]